ncbi:LysE family translocator [Aliiroseovarius sp. 2305UL8-7]|uniref:LysE family translocator n=1 Tax=Aliiroseovarius conchicola TaxID=3121637 RepID=UPI0035292716
MSASVVAILFAAAITPGPNNIVVMDAAARSRLAAAAAPIAGIVLGTLTLVLAVRFGVDAVLDGWVHGRLAMRFLGASLIAYLAVRIVAGGWHYAEEATGSSRSKASLFTAMLAFQLLNPKTWVLALTVGSVHAGVEDASIPGLITAVLIVPSLCLLL